MEQMDFLVCVRCFTYNHASYIEDAMNGFSMQQTSFPFVCVIIDDASTDGEQDVIKSYMNLHFKLDNHEIVRNEETDDYVLTFARHKDNTNCFFAVYFLKENLYNQKEKKISFVTPWREHCKYEAMCEGDDYWIDSNKLQSQINYMESHPECGLCYTNFNKFYQKTGELDYNLIDSNLRYLSNWQDVEEWIVNEGYSAPMTWLSRSNILLEETKVRIQSPDGTFVTFSYFLARYKVHCLKQLTTAVYRVVEESASHTKNIETSLKRTKGLRAAQYELVKIYVHPNRRKDVFDKLDSIYYPIHLKLFVALNDKEEIIKSKKWVSKSFCNSLLYFISEHEILRVAYKCIYKMLLKIK